VTGVQTCALPIYPTTGNSVVYTFINAYTNIANGFNSSFNSLADSLNYRFNNSSYGITNTLKYRAYGFNNSTKEATAFSATTTTATY
jgi:hypothetical protein